MRIVHLTDELSDHDADLLAGELLPAKGAYDILIGEESADVYKPNGDVLLKYRKRVLDAKQCETAYRNLGPVAAATSSNRGVGAGRITKEKAVAIDKDIAQLTATRYRPRTRNGNVSATTYAGEMVASGIVGYFDRYQRIPFCRQTAYSLKHPDRWRAVMPFVHAIDSVFRAEAPERYAAQRAVADATSEDFHISGTAFTTITVNKNWQTAVHKDKGDFPQGFGVLTVLQAGKYEGGYLVFPKFRVAVDLRSCDVLLCDVHEWHGNTPILPDGRYERVSLVFYYRSKMMECGTAEEEIEIAKNRKRGDPLYYDKHGEPVEGDDQ